MDLQLLCNKLSSESEGVFSSLFEELSKGNDNLILDIANLNCPMKTKKLFFSIICRENDNKLISREEQLRILNEGYNKKLNDFSQIKNFINSGVFNEMFQSEENIDINENTNPI